MEAMKKEMTGDIKTPVTMEVYNKIKDKIINLDLMPGQILMVQQLSRDLGISRTPVREAIIRLRDDGLVNETDGRKFRVSDITWKMIDDIYETRQALEILAIGKLARTITLERVREFQEIIARMERMIEQGDSAAYFSEDSEFHNKIFLLHNNHVMTACLERMKDQQQRIRYLTTGCRNRDIESFEEHERIVRCLSEGDSERACEEMRLHLDLAKENMKHLLQTRYPNALVKG